MRFPLRQLPLPFPTRPLNHPPSHSIYCLGCDCSLHRARGDSVKSYQILAQGRSGSFRACWDFQLPHTLPFFTMPSRLALSRGLSTSSQLRSTGGGAISSSGPRHASRSKALHQELQQVTRDSHQNHFQSHRQESDRMPHIERHHLVEMTPSFHWTSPRARNSWQNGDLRVSRCSNFAPRPCSAAPQTRRAERPGAAERWCRATVEPRETSAREISIRDSEVVIPILKWTLPPLQSI